MDFKQFEYIIKVSEMQSITKAANELFISQPSLSQYITKVEREIGEEIFDRSTNPISLTLAGEKFVETGKRILALNKDLKEEIFDISTNKKGRITIGIPRSRATFMLPYFIGDFREAYPNVEFRTKETSRDEVEENVLKGQVDFGIIPLPIYNFVKNKLLRYEVFTSEQLFLVTEKGYLGSEFLLESDVLDISKINDLPLILLNKGRGIRSTIDNTFYNYGVKPNVIMETTSNATAFRLASTGLGAAIVPNYIVNTYQGINDIDVFRLTKDGIHWKVAFVHQKDEEHNPLRDDLLRLLKDRFD